MRRNGKGGAALVAVLIMLILVAAGTAIMIVTGKGRIREAEDIPAAAKEESSAAESVQDTSAAESTESVEVQESEPEPAIEYPVPQKAADYKDIDYKGLSMSAKHAMLLDLETNEIIAGSKYDRKIYPASLTKVMSLVVAVENVKDPKAKYKFTEKDIAPLVEDNASVAGFEVGESVTFEDLLYASILRSGADGTLGLANMVAGSEKEFVKLMNAKAAEMGLENTHFTNASGLHDDDHYSTCFDMERILAYAMENETCRKVLTAKEYTTTKTKKFHPDGLTLYSIVEERILGWFVDLDGDGNADGEIIGGKTGFTDEAGFCMEFIYEYEGKTYLAITCFSASQLSSTEDCIKVLENYVPKKK